MDNSAIYSKTSRGMNALKVGAKNIGRDDARVLTLINGTSSVSDLTGMLDAATNNRLAITLESLLKLGLIRVFSSVNLDGPGDLAMGTSQNSAYAPDGMLKSTNTLPTIEVKELSLQESVQVWAEARRGATILEKKGFYAYGQKPSDPNSVSPANLIAGTGMNVMVIEDDESLSHLLESLLQHKNHTVQIVENVVDAITTLNGLAASGSGPLPDLVLLDVMLPGLPGKDGFHVLDYIRRHPALKQTPVIMVTSQITDEYVLRGIKAEADGYIFKPFKWPALYECIKSVTGR
ncbi:response regulator [Glaciimonas immobilis]|uniref:CheY-like chemotaxis protein n=1 Tax=Glaciimonas immobilis TaxID=728004 RepID=A0A840RUN8_9BURK|nr:response regulator [Glaciimonas immobilis]KAF3999902.1 response regulator [Glaciimonas immobilis]MBB5200394.1 CheY-like chemotaxis protein [Glaciimonas immobilis]